MTQRSSEGQASTRRRRRAGASSRVAVLDAGGQYVDLVRKAIERQGIPADTLALQTPRRALEADYAAIVISGSPASSHQAAAPLPDPDIWESQLPILGICYGMQAMTVANGGQVKRNAIREDGRVTTTVDTTHPLFQGSKSAFVGLFTHGDFVTALPEGFTAIGQHHLSDGSLAYSAIARGNKLGVQFHPEVFDDTPEGYHLFQNFLHGVVGLAADPSFQAKQLEQLIKTKQRAVAKQAGDRHVIAFVSGGVDSSVAATLAARVLAPDKFHAFYIDSGFMRDEDDMVIEALNQAGIEVAKIDAQQHFEQATTTIDGKLVGPLVKAVDPEVKRKIIGKVFVEIQNSLLADLGLSEALLLQGTIAADRIESGHSKGGSHTDTIKTHHNQVSEIQELKARGLLLEPLDDLFKDEVRLVGRALGLPEELVERQPFPGPGTAIRILGAVADRRATMQSVLERRVQTFVSARPYLSGPVTARMLPVKSVGVGGDERSHLAVVAIEQRPLTATAMAQLAHDIPAHFRDHVNRVVYALSPRSLAQPAVTKTFLTSEVRTQLRQADRIVFETMRALELLASIKQMPVILLPLSFGQRGGRSIVLRPITTTTFMTVQAMLPGRDLPEEFLTMITERILGEVPGITQVFLDLTNKPPGTVEWG